MRRAFTQLALPLLASSACLSGQQPKERRDRLSGIYSNVDFDGEHLSGLEIEIHASVAEPYALFVLCEGWCNYYHRVPIKLAGERFDFEYPERVCDRQHSHVEIASERFRGWRTGKAVVVEHVPKAGEQKWGRWSKGAQNS
jgi:hypothetical protein